MEASRSAIETDVRHSRGRITKKTPGRALAKWNYLRFAYGLKVLRHPRRNFAMLKAIWIPTQAELLTANFEKGLRI